MSEETWTEESLGQKSAEELKALLKERGVEAASEEQSALVAQLLQLQTEQTPAAEQTEAPPAKKTRTEGGEDDGCTVLIEGLVRPLNVRNLQSMLEARAGPVRALWLNAIKTHCYATFEHAEDAARARTELHGVHWPETSASTLTVRASTVLEAVRAERDEAAAAAAATAARRPAAPPAAAAHEEPAEEPPRAPAEPPVVVPLPDEYAQHYNKTETQPTLYWLPRDGKKLDL